jgi:hypothetical protein
VYVYIYIYTHIYTCYLYVSIIYTYIYIYTHIYTFGIFKPAAQQLVSPNFLVSTGLAQYPGLVGVAGQGQATRARAPLRHASRARAREHVGLCHHSGSGSWELHSTFLADLSLSKWGTFGTMGIELTQAGT